MFHHAEERDGGGAGEDGAVAHGELTLGLVSPPVRPGQAHSASMRLVPAGEGHLQRQPLRRQGAHIGEASPAEGAEPGVCVA